MIRPMYQGFGFSIYTTIMLVDLMPGCLEVPRDGLVIPSKKNLDAVIMRNATGLPFHHCDSKELQLG